MDKIKQRWLEERKEEIQSNDYILEWEEKLYNDVSPYFVEGQTLYCYSDYFLNKKHYYIEFSLKHQRYRFYFYEKNKKINWKVLIKNEKDHYYYSHFNEIVPENVEDLYEKVKTLVSVIRNKSIYRIKRVMKEIEFEKTNEYLDYMNQMKKEGKI